MRAFKSKYADAVRKSIDEFWLKWHCPPTIRNIMIDCNVSSTSLVQHIIRRLDDIRVNERGQAIPKWVDDLFAEKYGSNES